MKILSVKEVKVRRKDSLPDIDVDFESKRRDDVKRYIETKYSPNNVCSIGTYNRLKSKSAIKDLSRVEGANFDESNIVTKSLEERPTDPLSWGQVFEQAAQKSNVKKFINKYPKVFKFLKPILMQTRSSSVHPSAVVIVPDKDEEGNKMNIWDWMPVRLDPEKGVIISEWEGKYMDIAGFLKEDILGIAQLDKFRYTIDLIKQNRGIDVDFSTIPMDDPETYQYFCNGWNEDVFQFGTGGLKTYCKEVQPDNIEDLIAINALYRPGPMGSGAHKDFVNIRNGKQKPAYDEGMIPVTKNTAGLYIYQEQVMQGMVVGGMSLVESDMARTAIKKFDKVQLAAFESKFVKNYTKLTGDEKESKKVWDKMMSFSSYGFNKSHAAAYSVMGYWSQYLKVHFPLEFWTSSLNFCDYEDDTPNRLSEIRKTKADVSVKPPDINKSENKIVCDPTTNNIYYSLVTVKFVGDASSNAILKEREKNGVFYDMEEFLQRIDKSKVNKKVVTNLILAGAFDEMVLGDSYSVTQRLNILKEFYGLIKQDLPPEFSGDEVKKDIFWKVKQRELTGLGSIDYKEAASQKGVSANFLRDYVDLADFYKKPIYNRDFVMGGRVTKIVEKTASNNNPYLSINFETNSESIQVCIWGNDLSTVKDGKKKLEESEKNKSFLLLKLKAYLNKGYQGFNSGNDFKIITL